MKISLGRNVMRNLLIATILPFVLIVLLTLPLSFGLHGTTHSESGNYHNLGGYYDTGYEAGHYSGYVDIGDNTGWVFCNGKVRFFGELHIYDADFDYVIQQEWHSGSWFDFDYQEIEMNGERGNMVEGIPFFFLGFFGTAFGLVAWVVWNISRKRPDDGVIIAGIASVFGMISTFYLSFNRMCFIALIFIIPVAFLFLSFLRHSGSHGRWLVGVSFGIGLAIAGMSAMFIIFPNYYGIGGLDYNKSLADMSVILGTVGLISSAAMIGFGAGKVSYRKENPLIARPPLGLCQQCGTPFFRGYQFCSNCGSALKSLEEPSED